MMKNIIVACDSFKGSMSADEVCAVISSALKTKIPDCRVVEIPVADGGEGTVNSYIYALGGEKVKKTVKSPLLHNIEVYYGIVNGDTAVIECAAASGITIEKENNAVDATSFGTGQLVKDALDAGIRKFIIGLGGSACTDGGKGLLTALGGAFLNEAGKQVSPGGKGLTELCSVDMAHFDNRIFDSEITVLCDVTNPLFGKSGAAYVYAPQKGASTDDVIMLDSGLRKLAELSVDGKGSDYSSEPGTGAAGGLGFALMRYCGAKLKRGIDTILDITDFEIKSASADLVITGEGKMDSQSLCGKVPFGVAARSRAPECIAVVGVLDESARLEKIRDAGINSVYETNPAHLPFESVLPTCKEDLFRTVQNIIFD